MLLLGAVGFGVGLRDTLRRIEKEEADSNAKLRR